MKTVENELEWLTNILHKRHNDSFSIWLAKNGRDVVVKMRSECDEVIVPYAQLMAEVESRWHAFPTDLIVDRLWTLLLTTEQMLGLKHEYKPTRAFIEYLENLHGSTTTAGHGIQPSSASET